jgi:hypothetical protein
MPRFLVSMNVVEARSAKFIIQAEDEDSIWDGIGNIDMDILEENLEWRTSEYEPPVIDEIKTIPNDSKDYNISKKIQKEFDKSIKELSEEN